MHILSPRARRGALASALLLSGCNSNETLSAPTTGPRRVEGLTTKGPILHVNPADPVMLTRPTEDGELAQYLTLKDAEGIPIRLLGVRRFSLANPTAYDQLSLDANNQPARVTLRGGAQVLYEYIPGGRVRMTVILADGRSAALFFNFTPNTGLSSKTAQQSSLPLRASALENADAAATQLKVRVSVTEGASAYPVNDATVTGQWFATTSPGLEPLIGQFETQPIGVGFYESSIPIAPAPQETVQGVLVRGCTRYGDVISATCDVLNSPQGAFNTIAGAACLLFPPPFNAVCIGAVSVIDVICVVPVCDVVSLYADFFMQGPSTIQARASGVNYFAASNSTIATWPPPSSVDLAIGIPERGFTGHWVGTWSYQDGSPGGPAAFTLYEQGSSATGTYDLFYTIIDIRATIAGQTLTFGYRGFDENGFSNNVITLTRAGSFLAGEQVAFYDRGGSYTWHIEAARSGALPSTASSVTSNEARQSQLSESNDGVKYRPPVVVPR